MIWLRRRHRPCRVQEYEKASGRNVPEIGHREAVNNILPDQLEEDLN